MTSWRTRSLWCHKLAEARCLLPALGRPRAGTQRGGVADFHRRQLLQPAPDLRSHQASSHGNRPPAEEWSRRQLDCRSALAVSGLAGFLPPGEGSTLPA